MQKLLEKEFKKGATIREVCKKYDINPDTVWGAFEKMSDNEYDELKAVIMKIAKPRKLGKVTWKRMPDGDIKIRYSERRSDKWLHNIIFDIRRLIGLI